MSKRNVVIALVALAVGAGYFWLDGGTRSGSSPDPTVTSTAGDERFSKESLRQLRKAAARENAGEAPENEAALEQEILVLEQEQELLNLMAGYDEARADAGKREAHRAAMKEKLAAYSEAVLPVVLEKTQAEQEPMMGLPIQRR